ncbi:MAG: 13E12 repeat family protein, partial [Sandaracinaceae bacterium]|nr:13E12 repeat family protein [Sandaracinaceae bacterium]
MVDSLLDSAALEAELATLSAHIDAATHRQLTLIRLVDESGLWAHQGATSTPAWLSWRIGLALGAARERLRIARALVSLPAIDSAFSKGQLSYSKVRAMTRVATPENEGQLLELALHSTAAQLVKMCRSARSVERLEGRSSRDEGEERWVRHRVVDEGVVRIEAQLSADEAELVLEALRVVRETLRVAPSVLREDEAPPSLADAMVQMAELTISRPEAEVTRTGADRAQVIVHLAPDAFASGVLAATLDDGTRVSAEAWRRVACDCGLVGVSEDGRGHVLDVGRRTRSIPPA